MARPLGGACNSLPVAAGWSGSGAGQHPAQAQREEERAEREEREPFKQGSDVGEVGGLQGRGPWPTDTRVGEEVGDQADTAQDHNSADDEHYRGHVAPFRSR